MNKIEKALQRTSDTRFLLLEKGAVNRSGEVFARMFPGAKAIIIADVNTWNVAGRAVSESLAGAGVRQDREFVFVHRHFYAEWSFVEELEAVLKETEAVAVAVGSGVINDLCKYVSGLLDRKYMCVGTAASMDGFTSYGASITKDGNKQTFDCPAPYVVVMDPRIAADAPKPMAASGYADLIAKIPAGADWILARELGADRFDSFAFSLVQDGLKEALSHPSEIHNGNVSFTKDLCEGLLMSGFAMQAMQSSRPASGIEHQFSHYWDMEGLSYADGIHVSHGFKVGIGTLVSTAVWEFLLDRDFSALDIERCVGMWKEWPELEKHLITVFAGKPGHLSRAIDETKGKYIGRNELRAQLKRFVEVWPVLKPSIKERLFGFDELYGNLKAAGAPVEPEQICVSREQLRTVFRRVPYMRNRFTVIDIVWRLGLMEEVEDTLFGKGGRWEI